MKIETKFDRGDNVLVLVGSKLMPRMVSRITIEKESNGELIIRNWFKVETENNNWKYETSFDSDTFASKEEFLNQLEEKPIVGEFDEFLK